MTKPTTSPTTWAYAAGYVDADGTLTMDVWMQRARPFMTPMLIVAGVHLEPLEAIQDLFGAGKIRQQPRGPNAPPHWRPVYRLEIRSGKGLRPILPNLTPHLIVKRRHADLLLEFLAVRKAAGHQAPYGARELGIARELAALQIKGRHREIPWTVD